MKIREWIAQSDFLQEGLAMHGLMARLYPIPRSITGEGYRETLGLLAEHIPLEVHQVPSGTQVLDWRVPDEWNIRDAYIKDASGRRVVDLRQSSLHVVSYSTPVHRCMSLEELRPHLHSLPDDPDWIPYRTAYYEKTWGFCMAHRVLEEMKEGQYEVLIDSTLEAGHLTYGECLLPGSSAQEVLISTHACHPAMCNDNLSGVVVAAWLARALAGVERRFTYRFVFIPATIGAITWLARNEREATRIRHGLVLACLGDGGGFNYKRTRQGDAEIDQAAAHVLRQRPGEHAMLDFSPYGYDERQYGSPGFNLPIGSLTRTPNGRFPEYHTSADDLDFVRPEALGESLALILDLLEVLEGNRRYLNLNPKGEPQLGRRGLYRSIGGADIGITPLALLWVLNQSDGGMSLLDIAQRAGIPFAVIRLAAEALEAHDLLRALDG